MSSSSSSSSTNADDAGVTAAAAATTTTSHISASSNHTSVLTPVLTLRSHSSATLHACISPCGTRGLSSSAQRVQSVRHWQFPCGKQLFLPSNHRFQNPYYIRQSAFNGNASVLAVATWSASVRVLDANTGEILYQLEQTPLYPLAAGCALTPDASVLVAAFRAKQGRTKGCIAVARDFHRNARCVPTLIHRECSIAQCAVSNDGSKVAFKWRRASAGTGLEVLHISRDTVKTLCNWHHFTHGEWHFSMDAKANSFAVADERSLRVFKYRGSPKVKYMHAYKHGSFSSCSITQDALFLVASVADNKFAVWHVPSSSKIALLSAHTDRTNGCAISANGAVALTCSNDTTVRVWDLTQITNPLLQQQQQQQQQQNACKSPLLDALCRVLSPCPISSATAAATAESSSLTEERLHNLIVPQNVTSVRHMLAAHVLVLLSIRSGVLSPQSISPSSPNHPIASFLCQLYEPVCYKLHNQRDIILAQVAMLQAETYNLIPSRFTELHTGHLRKASEKLLRHIRDVLHGLWWTVLSEMDHFQPLLKVENDDEEEDDLSSDISGSASQLTDSDALSPEKKSNRIAFIHNRLYESFLAEQLSVLCNELNSRENGTALYVSIARCVVTLSPLLCENDKLWLEVSRSRGPMLANELLDKHSNLVAIIDTVAPWDISNPAVLSHILTRMYNAGNAVVVSAIEKSRFGSFKCAIDTLKRVEDDKLTEFREGIRARMAQSAEIVPSDHQPAEKACEIEDPPSPQPTSDLVSDEVKRPVGVVEAPVDEKAMQSTCELDESDSETESEQEPESLEQLVESSVSSRDIEKGKRRSVALRHILARITLAVLPSVVAGYGVKSAGMSTERSVAIALLAGVASTLTQIAIFKAQSFAARKRSHYRQQGVPDASAPAKK